MNSTENNRTELTPAIFALVDQLGADLRHDAKAASLIGELAKHIARTNATEERIEKKIGDSYVFARAEVTETETVPATFVDFFVSTLARVGMVYEMIRTAKLSDDDAAYINSRVTEAMAGSYVAAAAGLKIPSNIEVAEETVAEGFEPIVDLAQRVLKIETPKAKFRPEKIEKVLEDKRVALSNAETMISDYDPMVEEVFQSEVEDALDVALRRLELFRNGGFVDNTVVINPMFQEYEDQLLFEVDSLTVSQELGSKERQNVERAAEIVAVLRAEIGELSRSLAPIARALPTE